MVTVPRTAGASKKADGVTPPTTPKKTGGGVTKKAKATPKGKKGKPKGNGEDGESDVFLIPEPEERYPPCLQCLISVLAGKSDGKCMVVPGKNRYVRCARGGQCLPIERLSVLPPLPPEDEESHRRIAAKTILKGIFQGDFPTTGDARGEAQKGQASEHRQEFSEGSEM
ncbi:hypothetical protein FBULB1_274 [Fusarium bulbicola]|nr:hypothetical protein FBULB1_274 [Fusarium bulbicola]